MEALEYLSRLCVYDKRNPDCIYNDEEIKDHEDSLIIKNQSCSCDNCFYGRTKMAEEILRLKEAAHINIFKVACPSDCGSYFGGYLQSITVVADTKEDALITAKEWMRKTGNKFIYPEVRTKKYMNKREYTVTWDVFLVAGDIKKNTVIDTFTDSDY